MSLRQIQDSVDEWIVTQRDGYFSPLEIMACLTEENGELAAAVRANRPASAEPGRELADIAFMLVCLANALKIDLDHAMAERIQRRAGQNKAHENGNTP